jgi:hypothetical protein
MNRASLLPLLLVMACAHVGGDGSETPAGNRDAAQRIYVVAEERFAAGEYDEAVALMRHALLQLPPSPEHDRLRHQLVLRMAHTQLRAHAASGGAAPLHDAQQMLTRYLERHEKLFGDGRVARSERGEVYELLHQVEKRLEPVSIEVVDAGGQSETIVAAAPTDAAPRTDAPTAHEIPAEAAPTPARRRTDGEGNELRDVVVAKERRLASLDDPRVKERLRSPYSTGWLGGALTAPRIIKMRDARPLVRGHSQLAGDGNLSQQVLARRAGQSLLREARQDLRDCYASAYARRPVDVLDSAVEASVHPDGSISHVRIVEGGLVDGYGDACLIEALQGTVLPPLEETAEPVRVQVALVFFYEGTLYIDEMTGEQVHEGGLWLQRKALRLQGLPAIERSQRGAPARTRRR